MLSAPLLPLLAQLVPEEPAGETAAAANLPSSLVEVAVLALSGFILVIGTLALLWLITGLIGRYFKAAEQRRRGEGPQMTQSAVQSSAEGFPDLGSDRELAVIIAAAVAQTIGQPHRIVSIRPQSSAWSIEGRRSIFESHRIR